MHEVPILVSAQPLAGLAADPLAENDKRTGSLGGDFGRKAQTHFSAMAHVVGQWVALDAVLKLRLDHRAPYGLLRPAKD